MKRNGSRGYRGGRLPYDLTGLRFGKLLAVAVDHVDQYHTYWWLCKCDCGGLCTKRSAGLTETLKSNGVSSCGKCRSNGKALRKLYLIYKRNARVRGLDWSLTQDEFHLLTSSPCHYTGKEPSTVYVHWNDTYVYNGIDRVDNLKGYSIGNCVPCCKEVNVAKADMKYSDFIGMCSTIAQRFSQELRGDSCQKRES